MIEVRNMVIGLLLTFAAFISCATSSFADDKSVKLQVAEIATSFIEPLQMDKKYVLKSLSPDATGIPEDFLRKLTSDVEAGLLFASDNEMNLINRDATEEIWQEATEFNSAQFQELYAKSSADVMIMISPRLTADGVEISLTAYELTGEDVGKVLASSGTSVLKMDVKATLGVDVNGIDAKLDSVLEVIQSTKPNDYAQSSNCSDLGSKVSQMSQGEEPSQAFYVQNNPEQLFTWRASCSEDPPGGEGTVSLLCQGTAVNDVRASVDIFYWEKQTTQGTKIGYLLCEDFKTPDFSEYYGNYECPNGPSFQLSQNSYIQSGVGETLISAMWTDEHGLFVVLSDDHRFGLSLENDGTYYWYNYGSGDESACSRLD